VVFTPEVSTISPLELFPVGDEILTQCSVCHWDELGCEAQIVERLYRQYVRYLLETLGAVYPTRKAGLVGVCESFHTFSVGNQLLLFWVFRFPAGSSARSRSPLY
jgi:hypothetical protein